MTAPKPGTALAVLQAEVDVIDHRLRMATEKAEKYTRHHGRPSEHAQRIVDWVQHRKLALLAAACCMEDLAKAVQPFLKPEILEDGHVTINDIRCLREALDRIGEVP